MAISHICNGCGTDLAHVRVAIDPHYRLPLVSCPQCGRHAVRRRHPLAQGFRRLRRLDWSLTILAGQIAIVGGLLALTALIPVAVGGVAIGGLRPGTDDFMIMCIVLFGFLPLATGAWLSAGLPHWQRGRAWGAWIAFVTLLMTATLSFIAFTMVGDSMGGRAEGAGQRIIVMLATIVLPSIAAFLVMMSIATLGIPIGQLIRWSHVTFRRWRWRARRRRYRLAGVDR